VVVVVTVVVVTVVVVMVVVVVIVLLGDSCVPTLNTFGPLVKAVVIAGIGAFVIAVPRSLAENVTLLDDDWSGGFDTALRWRLTRRILRTPADKSSCAVGLVTNVAVGVAAMCGENTLMAKSGGDAVGLGENARERSKAGEKGVVVASGSPLVRFGVELVIGEKKGEGSTE
jgi:hypothetical protein